VYRISHAPVRCSEMMHFPIEAHQLMHTQGVPWHSDVVSRTGCCHCSSLESHYGRKHASGGVARIKPSAYHVSLSAVPAYDHLCRLFWTMRFDPAFGFGKPRVQIHMIPLYRSDIDTQETTAPLLSYTLYCGRIAIQIKPLKWFSG
jgi:hypothetical protein